MKLYIQYNLDKVSKVREAVKYGRWHQQWSFNVNGVSISSNNYGSEDDIEVDFQCKPGDIVYVLSAIYNDGDSFGTVTGKGEVMWVFADPKLAIEFKNKWEESLQSDEITFKIESGQEITLHSPAIDYFTRIDHIIINMFTISE